MFLIFERTSLQHSISLASVLCSVMKKSSKRAHEDMEEEPQPRKKAKLGDGLKWHKTLKVCQLLKMHSPVR